MPPLSAPFAVPNYRLDAHAIAFKSPRVPTVQPATVAAGSVTRNKRVCANGLGIFVCDRVNAAPGNVLRSTNRGASWAVSLASAGIPNDLEPVWSPTGAMATGMDVYACIGSPGTGIQRFTASAGAWGAVAGIAAVNYNRVAVADPYSRGLTGNNPFAVSAQTMIAVGGAGVGLGAIGRSADNGATWANIAIPVSDTFDWVCKGSDFWVASYITGAPDIGVILRSTDDGLTWAAAFTGSPVMRAFALDPNTGFMLGINGNKIYESSNGFTWNLVYTFAPTGFATFPGVTINSIIFDGVNTWIAATSIGSLLLSTDREIWREVLLPELNASLAANVRGTNLFSLFYENISDVANTRSNNLLYLTQQGAAAPTLYMGSGVLDYET